MDQDETTAEAVEEPTLTETKAEEAEGHDGEKAGKVIQTFLVRVTLRLNAGDGIADVKRAAAAVPTNERLAELVEIAIYDDVPYFDALSINATAEKV